MEHCTRKPGDEKEIPEFGPDSIEMAMRSRVRETIEAIVKEELEAALGAMDGWYPKVRIGGRRERVPVLVTLGVRANGERVVLDLRLVGEERAASRMMTR